MFLHVTKVMFNLVIRDLLWMNEVSDKISWDTYKEAMTTESRRRVSYAQLDVLWEFLNTHRDIAMGFNKSAQARNYSRRMWERVAETLNSLGEGATKDFKGWSTYWVDYKAKLKKKVSAIRRSQTQTGGGPSEAQPLNDVEKKFMDILGHDYGSGLPNVQVDPFPETPAPETETDPLETTTHLLTPSQTVAIPFVFPQLLDMGAPTSAVPESEDVSELAVPPTVTPTTSVADAVPLATVAVADVRRRRTARTPYSQEKARRLLVESSQAKLELSQKNSATFESILDVLTRISQTLQKIETRCATTIGE